MDEVFSWNVAQELVGKQPAERRRLISRFSRSLWRTEVVGADIDKSLIGFTVLRRFSHRYSVLLLGKLYNLGFFGVGLDRYRYLQPHD